MTRTIVQSKNILVPLVAALALLLAVACGSDNDEDRASGNTSDLLFSAGGSEAAAQLLRSGSSANTGIWVNGTGKATGDPNLGLLSLGVEALADTASEARETAAGAIEATISMLRSNDIQDRDMQTSRFSISPRYNTQEITRCSKCGAEFEQVLVGYQVTNTLTIKVRDLDNMGNIIDSAILAADDLVRINRVSFTIEDIKPLQNEAREDAIGDLLAKANAMATLAGVNLGKLVFLTESDGSAPRSFSRIEPAAAFGFSGDESTSILAGELDVNVNVQGVFAIAD